MSMPAPLTAMRSWFRHDVEDRLRDIVGGTARLRVVVLLAGVLALQSADSSTVGSTAVQLERAFHISNTAIGLLVTVSTAVGAVATLPLGVLVDRLNRVRILAGAILLWSVALVLSGASTSYQMLLATRLLLGVVVAIASPAVASLTGDLFPAAERGRIYGFILTGELIGTGVGFVIAGDVSVTFSWRYAFWILAVPGVLLAWAIWRLLPEPARGGQSRLAVGADVIRSAADLGRAAGDEPGDDPLPAADEGLVEQQVAAKGIAPQQNLVLQTDPAGQSLWWAVRYVLSIRTNRILILSGALGYFFLSGLQTFAVEFLRDRFSLGQTTATTLLVVLGAGAVLGVLVSGRLGDWLLERGHVTARPVVGGVTFVLAAGLFVPALLTTSLLLAAPLLFLAAAGLAGANPPLDAARLDLVHSRLWGRAEAVRTVLRSSLQAVAPLLFGYVSTQFGAHTSGLGHPTGSTGAGGIGLDRTFLVMLVPLAVSGLLLLVRARRTYPRDVATAVASAAAIDQAG